MFLLRIRTPSYLIYDATRLKGSFTYTENRTWWQPFGRAVLKGNLFKGCSCPPPCRITADPLNSRHISPPARVLQGRPRMCRLLIRSSDRDLSLEATVTNDALSSRRSLLSSPFLSPTRKSTKPKRSQIATFRKSIHLQLIFSSNFETNFRTSKYLVLERTELILNSGELNWHVPSLNSRILSLALIHREFKCVI